MFLLSKIYDGCQVGLAMSRCSRLLAILDSLSHVGLVTSCAHDCWEMLTVACTAARTQAHGRQPVHPTVGYPGPQRG